LPHGLFGRKKVNVTEGTIKFAPVLYSSELYQKKYKALGIDVTEGGGKIKKMMGRIDLEKHVGKN
jgi:uncharacterized SAM-binding protein YcdF (DUF218 family)